MIIRTPARFVLKAFTPLRGVRPFCSFAFESGFQRSFTKTPLRLRLKGFNVCEPDWIRTNDLLLRRQLLYPTELPVQFDFLSEFAQK
jgi:hypothetical protein